MTLDEILTSLFPAGHDVVVDDEGLISGSGPVDGARATVIGVANRAPLGVEGAAKLAAKVLAVIAAGRKDPLLVLVDSDSQRMSKRDEMLGLSEYLAHLSKCLILADQQGVPTIGILYGHTAAGAFIATALSTRVLVALPGADPEVMDLPSMARVTKLSIEVLKEKAKSTPVFAPGLDQSGADRRRVRDMGSAKIIGRAIVGHARFRGDGRCARRPRQGAWRAPESGGDRRAGAGTGAS